jgi:hypothetical protein
LACEGDEAKVVPIAQPAWAVAAEAPSPDDMAQRLKWTQERKLVGTFIDASRRLVALAHGTFGLLIVGQGSKTPFGDLVDWVDSRRVELLWEGKTSPLQL